MKVEVFVNGSQNENVSGLHASCFVRVEDGDRESVSDWVFGQGSVFAAVLVVRRDLTEKATNDLDGDLAMYVERICHCYFVREQNAYRRLQGGIGEDVEIDARRYHGFENIFLETMNVHQCLHDVAE